VTKKGGWEPECGFVCMWLGEGTQVVVQCHGSAGQAVVLAGPPPLSMALFISLQTQIGLLASESGQGISGASLWVLFMGEGGGGVTGVASSQHSCLDVLVRSSSFSGLEAGMISVSSKMVDPSCSARFDQTLPLAWQIHSRGSFVNAQASKQEHKTRCSKRTDLSDQTLINRHNSRK